MAKLIFFYSVMNAGKSTPLLQVNHNYQSFGSRTMIFNHTTDDRSSESTIESRLGISQPCHMVNNDHDMYLHIKKEHRKEHISCVLVDEIQFFTEQQIYDLSNVVDHLHIPVMCYGLKTNAFGELFEGSKRLIELADSISEIKQLCFCGSKATMVLRFDEEGNIVKEGNVIDTGAEEKYSSVCRKHWKNIQDLKHMQNIIKRKSDELK